MKASIENGLIKLNGETVVTAVLITDITVKKTEESGTQYVTVKLVSGEISV